jgi:O-antigen/teichoic acid export membrane protein
MFRSLLNYAPVQVFSALSIFLLIAVQTSYLTVESYGLLAIFMLIMEVVRSCSSQWINTSLLRLYPSEKDPKRLALAATALKMIWGLYMPALGFVGLGLLYYQALELMSLLALGAL